jgi:hypothetical protein
MDTQFFLGANSPGGFASYYNEWLDYGKIKRFYIIKGTPGNGKSGFMKRIAKRLGDKGYEHEAILCSSDPASLDGLYFPKLGTAFVDGAAPHIIEPIYPLAVENYLPLTQFVDDAAIAQERGAIISLRDNLRQDYTRLSRILAAVKSLREEQRAIVSCQPSIDTITRRAQGFVRREIRKGTGGALRKRFLSALSPGGENILWGTVDALSDRVVELQDPYRLADFYLRPVMEAALDAGLEVYACYDPINPHSRLCHLILPDLKLTITSSAYHKEPHRRIRLDASVPAEIIKRHRHRLRFLRKTEAALMEDACGVVAECSEKHGMLEDIYNPHVDFSSVRALSDSYAKLILS